MNRTAIARSLRIIADELRAVANEIEKLEGASLDVAAADEDPEGAAADRILAEIALNTPRPKGTLCH